MLGFLPPPIKVSRSVLNGRFTLLIKKYVAENPTATLKQMKDALDLPVSVLTLCRFLNKIGMTRKLAKREIVISDVNRVKRLDFARRMLAMPDEYIAHIMWTDETKVKAYPNGELVFYRVLNYKGNGQQYKVPRVQNGGVGVMFWGCMTRQAYGPLVVIDGTMDGRKYLELLKEYVLPEIEASSVTIVFQQDNAPCHKRKSVMSFLSEQRFKTLELPPQSPDLSPIENIWNVVKMPSLQLLREFQ
jgi:hypothetical protein